MLVAACVTLSGCRSVVPPISPMPSMAPPSMAPTSVVPPIASATIVATTLPPTSTPGHTPSPSPSPTDKLPTAPVMLEPLTIAEAPIPGHEPEDVVLIGERAYVCNRASNNVSIIEDGRVARVVPVGYGPSAITADATTGRVYVLNQGDSSLSVIEQDRVIDTWTLEAPCSSMALVGQELWMGMQQDGQVLVLDARAGGLVARASISNRSAVFALVPHIPSGCVYAATYGRIHAIAIGTLKEVAVVSLPNNDTMGVSSDGTRVYVTAWDADQQLTALRVLAAHDLQPLDSLPLDGSVADVLTDRRNGRILLLRWRPAELLAYDPSGLQLTGRLELGLGASAMALSDAGDRLYVAQRDSDNLVIVDNDAMQVVAIVPLTLAIDDLAVSGETGRLLAASGGAGRVYAVADGQSIAWPIDGYPYRVEALSDGNGAAVLSRADGLLRLLDADGRVTHSVPAGDLPDGLSLDPLARSLYAGDVVLNLSSLATDTLRVPTIYQGTEPPRQVVYDTQRNRLYAVAFNGVPGSNGGYQVTRFGPSGADVGAPVPGRLSVIDLLYDSATDRFFSTNARMGTFGLQVSAAADCREELYQAFDRYPEALALNPATHHLWVALRRVRPESGGSETRVVALDTRSLGEVARFELDDVVACIAVDPARSRIYLGSANSGKIQVIQDVALPAPEGPTPTFSSTPWPTSTTTPVPSATRTLVPTKAPTATPKPPPTAVCAITVDQQLLPLWEAHAGRDWLGCPVSAAHSATWAAQPFERGLMLWRGDTGVVYVLREDGTYVGFSDAWREDMPAESCPGVAPAGLFKPQRGFGLVWCNVLEVAEHLGWATEGERAVVALFQPNERGWMLLDDHSTIYAVGADGRWASITP